MENWSSFWKLAYFASLIFTGFYFLLIGMTYLGGHLRGQTEAEWTIRLFGAMAMGVATGIGFACLSLIKGKDDDGDT